MSVLSRKIRPSLAIAVSAAAAAIAGGGEVVTDAANVLVAESPNANLWFVAIVAGVRAVAVALAGRNNDV